MTTVMRLVRTALGCWSGGRRCDGDVGVVGGGDDGVRVVCGGFGAGCGTPLVVTVADHLKGQRKGARQLYCTPGIEDIREFLYHWPDIAGALARLQSRYFPTDIYTPALQFLG